MDFAQDKQERANNFGKARRRFRVEWPNNGTNRRQRRAACFQASSAERKPPLGDKTCQTKVPSRATLCQPDESDSGDRIARRRRMDLRSEMGRLPRAWIETLPERASALIERQKSDE